MPRRKALFYVTAVALGVGVVAVDRVVGWDAGISYALAGFAGALLLGFGLPFALIARDGVKQVGRVEPIEATVFAPNLVRSKAATETHVVVRITGGWARAKAVEQDKLAADGPDLVPANGAQRARAKTLQQAK